MAFLNYSFDVSNKILSLNEIKRGLISRDLNKQINAVEAILARLSSSDAEYVESLVNADIVELLCETSCTTNTFLLQLIFRCFSRLIKSNNFFKQNHTVHTFESLFRTLHILTRTDSEREALIKGLHLVRKIISRLEIFSIELSSVCDVPSLINICLSLLKTDSNDKVIYAVAEVTVTILYCCDGLTIIDLVIEALLVSLRSLGCSIKKNISPLAIALIAQLTNGSFSYLSKNKEKIKYDELENIGENLARTLFEELHMGVKEIIVPFLLTDITDFQSDSEILQVILPSLLSVYRFPGEKLTEVFSYFLISVGFLAFLQKLENQTNDNELIIAARSIIFELLICLSLQVLGLEKWHQLLQPGLEALPIGSEYTDIFMRGSDSIIPLASIIYNYFYLLSSPSPITNTAFLKDLCRFVMLEEKQLSYPIIKALWFIFCVAYVCNAERVPESRLVQRKIVDLIINYELRLIISYHPAILYWAFSDHSIPCELQSRIIILWLEKDDSTSISAISSVIKVNKNSLFLTMELMTECEINISKCIDNILNSILPVYGNTREIFQYAWSLLPKLLIKFTSNPEKQKYEGVTYVIKYCCHSILETLDSSVIMRISCILPGAFSKYFHIAFNNKSVKDLTLNESEITVVTSTFNIANNILMKGIESNDQRVTSAFIGNEGFLTSVQYFTDTDNATIINVIMELLNVLILSQKKFQYKIIKMINLDGIKILKSLQGEAKLSIATLRFLVSYFEVISENVECIVNVPQPSELQLRALYLHIHMLCAKCDDVTASSCWLCLRKLLEFSERMELKHHLAGLPYTPILLLRASDGEAWKEAVEFLRVWITSIPLHAPGGPSQIMAHDAIQKLYHKFLQMKNGPQLIESLNMILRPEKVKDNSKEDKIKLKITSQK